MDEVCRSLSVVYVSPESAQMVEQLSNDKTHDKATVVQNSVVMPEWIPIPTNAAISGHPTVGSALGSPPQRIGVVREEKALLNMDERNPLINPHTTPMSIFKIASHGKLDHPAVSTPSGLEIHFTLRDSDGLQYLRKHVDPQGRNILELQIQYLNCAQQAVFPINVTLHPHGCPSVHIGWRVDCTTLPAEIVPKQGLMVGTKPHEADVVYNGRAIGGWGDVGQSTALNHVDKGHAATVFYVWCKDCSPPVYFQRPSIAADMQVVWPSLELPSDDWPLTATEPHKAWFPTDEKPRKVELIYNCHGVGWSVVLVSLDIPFYKDVQFLVRKHCTGSPLTLISVSNLLHLLSHPLWLFIRIAYKSIFWTAILFFVIYMYLLYQNFTKGGGPPYLPVVGQVRMFFVQIADWVYNANNRYRPVGEGNTGLPSLSRHTHKRNDRGASMSNFSFPDPDEDEMTGTSYQVVTSSHAPQPEPRRVEGLIYGSV